METYLTQIKSTTPNLLAELYSDLRSIIKNRKNLSIDSIEMEALLTKVLNAICDCLSEFKAHFELREFYSELLGKFVFRKDLANEIGGSIGISEKTVENYLDKLCDKGLLKCRSVGQFEKQMNN